VARHIDLPTPGYFTGPEVPVAVLSGVVAPEVGAWLGEILVGSITDELRHKEGISYEVDGAGARIGETESLLAVWSDRHEDKMPLVAQTMWRILERLATDGPTAEELAHTRAVLREQFDDPRAIPEWLAAQAARMLRGYATRTRAEQRELDAAVTIDDIREAAKSVPETAVLFLHEGDYDLPGVRRLEDREIRSDRLLGEQSYRRKALVRAPRDLEIWVGPSGFSLTVQGQTGSAAWDDIVGVAKADGMRGIVTADGRQFPVVGKCFKSGAQLLEQIDELAGERLFTATEEVILD
jgi:hypothetical protein